MNENTIELAKLLSTDDAFNLAFSSAKTDEEKFELSKSKIDELTREGFSEFLQKLRESEKSNLSQLSPDELQMVSGGAAGWVTKLAAATMFVTALGVTGMVSHNTEALPLQESIELSIAKTIYEDPLPETDVNPHIIKREDFKKFFNDTLRIMRLTPNAQFRINGSTNFLPKNFVSVELYSELQKTLDECYYIPIKQSKEKDKTQTIVKNETVLKAISATLEKYNLNIDNGNVNSHKIEKKDVLERRLKFAREIFKPTKEQLSYKEWGQMVREATFSLPLYEKLLECHPRSNAPSNNWDTAVDCSSCFLRAKHLLQGEGNSFFTQSNLDIGPIDEKRYETVKSVESYVKEAEKEWTLNRPKPEALGLQKDYYELPPDAIVSEFKVQAPHNPNKRITMYVSRSTIDHIYFGDFNDMGGLVRGGYSEYTLKNYLFTVKSY